MRRSSARSGGRSSPSVDGPRAHTSQAYITWLSSRIIERIALSHSRGPAGRQAEAVCARGRVASSILIGAVAGKVHTIVGSRVRCRSPTVMMSSIFELLIVRVIGADAIGLVTDARIPSLVRVEGSETAAAGGGTGLVGAGCRAWVLD